MTDEHTRTVPPRGASDGPTQTVLVTGATGFIGRPLSDALVRSGAAVRCLVRPHHTRDVFTDDRIDVAFGDVTDPASLRSAMEGVDTVFHLAGCVGDWGPPSDFHAANVEGARNLLDAAAQQNARVVMASSIIVYGEALRTAVCDEDVGHGKAYGAYGATKQAQEELAQSYAGEGLSVISLRLGNVYGPHSRVWVDSPVEYLATGLPSLIGSGDGNACLLHVDNAVAAFVAAWRARGDGGGAYNVVDGTDVTWREYIGDLARLTGAPPPKSMPRGVASVLAAAMESTWRVLGREHRPPLTREALVIVSSRMPVPVDRARERLSYEPSVSYEEGLRSVAEYLHST